MGLFTEALIDEVLVAIERVHEQGRCHPVRDWATAIPQAAPAR